MAGKDDSSQSRLASGISGWMPHILALLGVGLGLAFSLDPLISPRPMEPHGSFSLQASAVEIRMRLWEDPFDPGKQKNGTDTEQVTLTKGDDKGDDKEAAVGDFGLNILVSLPSGPRSDFSEMRQRTRYAIVSALLAAQYRPVFEDFVKKWPYHEDPIVEEVFDSASSGFFPIEDTYYGPKSKPNFDRPLHGDLMRRFTTVRVLYIPEKELFNEKSPVDNIEKIVAGAELYDPAEPYHFSKIVSFDKSPVQWHSIYLGPTTSAHLRELLRDFSVLQPALQNSEKFQPGILWLSPWASIDNKLAGLPKPKDLKVFKKEEKKKDKEEKKKSGKPAHEKPFRLFRTTCEDSRLSALFVQEFKQRQLIGGGAKRKVVLITEADSTYGRAFPLAFQEALHGEKGVDLSVYTYLSGIDGRGYRQQESIEQSGKGADDALKAYGATDSSRRLQNLLEPKSDILPLGTAQYDRIRALAEELRRIDAAANLPFHEAGAGIAAVGLVGNDPYDKMVLLEALRRVLPHTLFFTPDLDALYGTAQFYPWTQGLLVASSYGLELKPAYQMGVPPMRDSYQTAVFASTLGALNYYRYADWLHAGQGKFEDLSGDRFKSMKQSEAFEAEDADATELKARLYTKYGTNLKAGFLSPSINPLLGIPSDDKTKSEAEREKVGLELFSAPQPQLYVITRNGSAQLHPQYAPSPGRPGLAWAAAPGPGEKSPMWVAFALFFLVTAGLVWVSGDVRGKGSRSFLSRYGPRMAAGALLVALFAWLVHVWHGEGSWGEEPFGWLDGVNPWTGETFRIGIIVLAVAYIGLAIDRLLCCRDGIEELLGKPGVGKTVKEIWKKAKGPLFEMEGAVWLGAWWVPCLVLALGWLHFSRRPTLGIYERLAPLHDGLQLIEIAVLALVFAQIVSLSWRIGHGLIRPLRAAVNPDSKVDPIVILKIAEAATAVFGTLLFFPFLLLTFVSFTECRFISGWPSTWGVLALVSGAALLLLAAGSWLWRETIDLKRRIRCPIENRRMQQIFEGASRDEIDESERKMSLIDGLSGGAFSDFSANPNFQCLVLGLAGIGIPQLIEYIYK